VQQRAGAAALVPAPGSSMPMPKCPQSACHCVHPVAGEHDFTHSADCNCAFHNGSVSASSSSLPSPALVESAWCAKERQECKEHCRGEEINFVCSDTFGGCTSAPHGGACTRCWVSFA
jgi:hypothetical protein